MRKIPKLSGQVDFSDILSLLNFKSLFVKTVPFFAAPTDSTNNCIQNEPTSRLTLIANDGPNLLSIFNYTILCYHNGTANEYVNS